MYIMPFDPQFDVNPAPNEPSEHPEPVRELIIKAAGEAFAREGYAATTVASIALMAGLPKSNVLYYFKSKDNLYAQVLEDIAPPYLNACMPLKADDEPFAALTGMVTAMISLFERQPFAAKVFMIELKEGARRLPGETFERWSVQAQKSVASLRQWIDRGLLAPVDPEHVLLSLWAIAQSCVSLGWQIPSVRGQGIDYQAAASTATRLLLSGLTPASPALMRRAVHG
ncbi:TetR/AcrR family transcriptional regulator [Pseudomonas abieticivorans]|uniref:TetR/AcrR family transcriptional regulator n=1 Tax=Pseudomonas abieticivorans TaxID=2931382 RepID=UPI0020BF52E0|nr:TetR/AcrR family transcriptional regulator [Pseudomonas sp. PIA16]